jgi:hypothetical protein
VMKGHTFYFTLGPVDAVTGPQLNFGLPDPHSIVPPPFHFLLPVHVLHPSLPRLEHSLLKQARRCGRP